MAELTFSVNIGAWHSIYPVVFVQFIMVTFVLTNAAQGTYVWFTTHGYNYVCTIAISQACKISVISNSWLLYIDCQACV